MKRILMLLMAVVLVLSMASLVACEPETPEGGEETTTEAPSTQEETMEPSLRPRL